MAGITIQQRRAMLGDSVEAVLGARSSIEQFEQGEKSIRMETKSGVRGWVVQLCINHYRCEAACRKEIPNHYLAIYDALQGVLDGLCDRHKHRSAAA
jgi:hypothetical protein